MKTNFKHKLLFINLLCLTQFNSAYSQQTWTCIGVETPSSGSVNIPASCSRNSLAWINRYNKVSSYEPANNSPMKVLGINFIIFQNDVGGNNFTNADLSDLNLIFG